MAAASCDTLMRTVRSADPSNVHSTRSALNSTSPASSEDADTSNVYEPAGYASTYVFPRAALCESLTFVPSACVPVTSTVTEAGTSSSPAASTTKLSSCSSAASRSASCCCEAGWSGCCTCASSPEAMPAMIVIPSSNEHAANPSVAFGAARTGEPSVAFLSRTNSPSDTAPHAAPTSASDPVKHRTRPMIASTSGKRLRGGTAGSSPEGNSTMPPSNEPGLYGSAPSLPAASASRADFADPTSLTARSASPERASSRSGRSIGSSPMVPILPSNGRVSPKRHRKRVAPPSNDGIVLRKRASPALSDASF